MPDDHEQIVVRRRKLAALRERGPNPYPNDFRPDHTTAEVHARFGGLADDDAGSAPARCAVAGRVVASRDFGKAGFLQVQDRERRASRSTRGATASAKRPSTSTRASTWAT